MKRLVLLLSALLTAAGCANPTAPDDAAAKAAEAARAANAKGQLAGAAPTSPASGKIATN